VAHTAATYPLILTFFHMLFVLWLAIVLATVVKNTLSNITRNEDINRKRYPYLWHEGQFASPWNRGLLSNIKDAFFPNPRWRTLYSLKGM